MNHTTKQLREKIKAITDNIQVYFDYKGGVNVWHPEKLELDILALLDSVREEYKGMIEEHLKDIELGTHPTPRETGEKGDDRMEGIVQGQDYVIKRTREVLAQL